MLVLLTTSLITPWRIAFYDVDSIEWVIADSVMDFVFFVDIILNFFMAYYDDEDEIVDCRCTIAKSYLKTWFTIDFIAIIPISIILRTDNYNSLARIARLPKLYRLIKMARLARILKVVKERNTVSKYLNEMFKLSASVERLLFLLIMFVVLSHTES